MTALVLPIGHYLGRDASRHRVRIGARSVVLADDNTAATWMLAHGVPKLVSAQAWTAEAMRAAAGPDADRVAATMSVLVADGVLVEVATTGPDAERFARTHRLCPLLTGLGPHPEMPGWYALGRPGEPVVLVPEFAYEVWRWAPTAGSLWDAGELFAAAEGDLAILDGDLDEEPDGRDGTDDAELRLAEPDAAVTDVLYALHLLLASHTAYIDAC
ncbi:hypothetical protein Drose_25725 [Dactylosporangium roseum]|uniref:Uncharacterized protein n=1 Tax=Dactylosporangium roseum TaxID=47989 RepID=A0ABY5Z1I3_9ACTN|nr:hypothetical protein [Dactylosporangium roseum]UWZ34608.1 hypothetical protein Drose_25725 [Dactylosporangium roseum]